MSSGDRPVLDDATIGRLILLEKPVDATRWRRLLAVTHQGFVGQDSVEFPGLLDRRPTRGTLSIYVRVGAVDGDYSAGLTFTDLDGNTYRLIRCNGPSHPHRNQLEGDKILYEPHIHRLTERYQRSRFKDDGHAEATDTFTDPAGALAYLARLTNVTPVGTLFL